MAVECVLPWAQRCRRPDPLAPGLHGTPSWGAFRHPEGHGSQEWLVLWNGMCSGQRRRTPKA